MSFDQIEQRTPDWHEARLGKVTCSALHKVMATGRGGAPSATREEYLCAVALEVMTGRPQESGYQNAAMIRGTELEPEARLAYEVETGAEVTEIGFAEHPEIESFGGSPDGLIDGDGGIEIKCPGAPKHMDTLLRGKIDRAYLLQMQGLMACTGRSWWDFVSYHPDMPTHARTKIIRVKRDPSVIVEIEKAVRAFLADRDARIEEVMNLEEQT